MMRATPLSSVKADESGFTFVEIIMALFIVGLLALTALPLMATSLKASSQAATTTAANQRVQQVIEDARVVPINCARLTALANNGAVSYADGRANAFTVQLTLPSGCVPTTNPQAVPVKVVATRTAGGRVLTSVLITVFVPGTPA